MELIPLSKNKSAIVDDEDYEYLSKYHWYCSSSGYANRHPKMVRGVRKGKIMMHREVMNTPDGMQTDHINGNKLDNRKSNLRIVNSAQNIWNSTLKSKGVTGIKNVSISNDGYQVRVMKNGKRYFLGVFKDLSKAVLVAEKARNKYYGEYARH